MNWMFSLTISKSRNLKPFSTIMTIPVLSTFRNGVLSSNQSPSWVFHRNRESLIRTSPNKCLCAFTRGKHHFCPERTDLDPARSKTYRLVGQETGTGTESGRRNGQSPPCLWRVTFPPLHTQQEDQSLTDTWGGRLRGVYEKEPRSHWNPTAYPQCNLVFFFPTPSSNYVYHLHASSCS